MSNRRMELSGKSKDTLDILMEKLEIKRPMAVKISLAKGISISKGSVLDELTCNKNKWTIPDNIIKNNDFLLFKHLIISEVGEPLDDDQLHRHMLAFIEKGLREIDHIFQEKASIEDIRTAII